MWALAGELLSRARIPEAFLFATSIIGSFCIQVALLLPCPCDCLLYVSGVPVSYFRAHALPISVSATAVCAPVAFAARRHHAFRWPCQPPVINQSPSIIICRPAGYIRSDYLCQFLVVDKRPQSRLHSAHRNLQPTSSFGWLLRFELVRCR